RRCRPGGKGRYATFGARPSGCTPRATGCSTTWRCRCSTSPPPPSTSPWCSWRRGPSSTCRSGTSTRSRRVAPFSRGSTCSPARAKASGVSRGATASPGRPGRWGDWGAISGPPMFLAHKDTLARRLRVEPAVRVVRLLQPEAVREQPLQRDLAVGDEARALLLADGRERPSRVHGELATEHVLAHVDRRLPALADDRDAAPRAR